MTATFFRHGRGRSINAESAEIDGRHPLTRAAQKVKEQAGCTLKQAREACLGSHDGEWHHVGKFASRVNYYSVAAAVAWLAGDRLPAGERGLPDGWYDVIATADDIHAAAARVAATSGQTVSAVWAAYYDCRYTSR